jgi:hypothetical protein
MFRTRAALVACALTVAACGNQTVRPTPAPAPKPAPATTAPAPDPTGGRQAAQNTAQGLIAHVPGYLVTSCVNTAPDLPGATEALECDPLSDPQKVLYYQFDNRADLDAATQRWVGGLLQGTGDCQSGFDGHLTYNLGGQTAGDLVCTDNDGWAWSDWHTGIFAVAYDQYFHAQDFYQWWANAGGTTDS